MIREVEIKAITQRYRLLKFLPPNSFEGQIELIIGGEIFHTFDLKILIHPGHPYRFPMVWETNGDIPRIVRRHVFPDTGHLCLGVEVEERMTCINGLSLTWFFDKVLLPRLADEYCVMNGGEYQKERSHGPLGDWEFYLQELNTNRADFVLMILILLKMGIPPRLTDRCPCNSGNSFSECHAKPLERFIGSYYKMSPKFWDGELNKLVNSRRWLQL